MSELAKAAERKKEAHTVPHASEVTRSGFFVKLVLMMLIDALGIYGMFIAYLVKSRTVLTVLVVLLLVISWVHFSKRIIPAKYLAPGMVFLLIYQVFVMGYAGYVSLTNYGQGHNSNKADAVTLTLQASEQRAEDVPSLPAAVAEDGNSFGLVVVDIVTGTIHVGDSETPLHEVSGTYVAGTISAVDGYRVLVIAEILQPETQQKVLAIKASTPGNPNDGSYCSDDGSTAYLAKSRYNYDGAADTLADTTTSVIYMVNNKTGASVDADGNQTDPGWRVFVGLDNYMNMFTRGDLVGSFLKALSWSLVFATAPVLSTFALGLILGLVFADKHIKDRKVYQSLMILPYVFPAFLATLVWKGMFSKDFGFVNEVLLGSMNIPWLTDGTLAKFSTLGVSLQLDFPYTFLVCPGALQSLSGDVEEVARIDGVSGLYIVWFIKLPLVLQSTVPLLIASFAFNFDNLSLVYMLTGGDPSYPGLDVGQTDILILMVYRIATESGSPDHGLASAMSVVIFIVVDVIAWFDFRQTKTLEELW